VSEARFQLLRGVAFVVAVALAMGLQRLTPHARPRGSWQVNGGLWCVNLLVVGLACGACACTVARWAAGARFGVLNVVPMPGWCAVPVTLVALDFVSYGWHRANHRIPFLWRFHRVHHTDPSLTVSTGVRFHPGELLLSFPVRLGAVALLGASAEAVVLFEACFTVANLLEHGDIDLPLRFERALGRVCVTPALHRRHHAKLGPDRDPNFGTIWSIWDRLLGTFVDNDSATAVDTGLPGFDHVTLPRALVLPLRRTA